jgi:hypothetical protein
MSDHWMTVKSESVLIVTAAACALVAATVGAVQYLRPQQPVAETAQIEEDEPPRIPLPAGPRKFQ